jgi:hypothetical protein
VSDSAVAAPLQRGPRESRAGSTLSMTGNSENRAICRAELMVSIGYRQSILGPYVGKDTNGKVNR